MISTTCDFTQFVDAVKGKDHLDIIQLAEQEATEAWRQSMQKNSPAGRNIQINLSYQTKLLGLIDYIRHGLQSREFSPDDRQLLQQLSQQEMGRAGKRQTA